MDQAKPTRGNHILLYILSLLTDNRVICFIICHSSDNPLSTLFYEDFEPG